MSIKRYGLLKSAIKHGSLRKAAAVEGISQPSLSAHIRRLEEELNIKLLLRGPSGVEPTQEALALMPNIDAVIDAHSSLEKSALEISADPHGKVVIGAVSLFISFLIPEIISTLQSRHSKSTAEIVESGAGKIEQMVLAREADLGFVIRSPIVPADIQLRYIDLAVGNLHVCGHPGDPIAASEGVKLEQLRGRQMISHAPGTFLRKIFDHFEEPYELEMRTTTDSGLSTQRLIASSGGIAFSTSTDFAGLGEANRIVFRPVVDPETPVMLSIVLRSDEPSSKLASLIIRTLRSRRDEFAWPFEFTPL